MSNIAGTIAEMKKMLANLERWVDKGVEHATAKKFEPSVLLNSRLVPDQYPLTRQIQAACDAAKFGAARVAGKTPPAHPDTETTVDELKTRIRAVVEYLGSFSAADYAGADKVVVELPWMPGKALAAHDYLNELATPNFYFHITTAYAILRHNGVELGKQDYIGSLNLRDK